MATTFYSHLPVAVETGMALATWMTRGGAIQNDDVALAGRRVR